MAKFNLNSSHYDKQYCDENIVVDIPKEISNISISVDNGRFNLTINGIEVFDLVSFIDGSIVLERNK